MEALVISLEQSSQSVNQEAAALKERLRIEGDEYLARGHVWTAEGSTYRHIMSLVQEYARNIGALLRDRKDHGLSADVLELFGPGERGIRRFMLNATSWTGVTTLPSRDIRGVQILAHNLFSEEGRKGVERYLLERSIDPGIVICNPVGALVYTYEEYEYSAAAYIEVYWELLSWMYRIVSDRRGLLFSQLPGFEPKEMSPKKWAPQWLEIVKNLEEQLQRVGFLMTVYYGSKETVFPQAIRFEKGADSPVELPSIQWGGV